MERPNTEVEDVVLGKAPPVAGPSVPVDVDVLVD